MFESKHAASLINFFIINFPTASLQTKFFEFSYLNNLTTVSFLSQQLIMQSDILVSQQVTSLKLNGRLKQQNTVLLTIFSFNQNSLPFDVFNA